MVKQFLEIGEIVGTHGVRGEIRVYPWADSGEFLCNFKTLYFDEGKRQVKILRARVHKNVVIMKLDGIDTVEDAAALRSQVLWMNRDDAKLEEGTYFIQDLIGLDVIDVDSNVKYGILSDVSFTGANDVYHIKAENGKETLIAAVPSVVIETDVENGFMKIRPLKGTFEDED